MENDQSKQQEILAFISQRKAFIDNAALKALVSRKNWKEITEELIKEKQLFINLHMVEKKAVKTKIDLLDEEKIESGKRDHEFNYRIMSEYDVTGQSYSNGTVKDFLNFFQNKFLTLKKLLQARQVLSPKEIKNLKKVAPKEEVDIIGMVSKKWQTKNGHTAIRIEDMEQSCIVVLLKDDRKLELARGKIMLDDVIGVRASKITNEMLIAKEIYWADLPQRKMKTTKKDVRIASISDMHIGSKLFLEKPYAKFIEWINGRLGTEEERKEVKKIKYLMVTGDNVDGIGIYPKQFDELSIKDIYEQYKVFSNYILQIPKDIQIFIIPGQHDGVRWADPQPAIPKKLVPKLYEAENIHLMGSPSWVEIEGFKTLLYHGSGLHDLFSNVSGLDYSKPQNAVIELLKKRDLMPAYGISQPYVPEKKDYMVIREEPDLVFMGDLHHVGYAFYRGTMIINNSTWQGRTDYQVKLGHVPTPGIVPVIELKTGRIQEKQFYKVGE